MRQKVHGQDARATWRDYWRKFGALKQIDPAASLIIADFELGPDAFVFLNFATDSSNPSVWRLRWSAGRKTDWVQCAKDFREFVDFLGFG